MCGSCDCVAGWLLRLTCDTKLREEFETLHQAVLELLKVRTLNDY
jgi:hypothetical protein